MEGKTYSSKDLLIAFGYSPTTYIKDTVLKKFIDHTGKFYRISSRGLKSK